ncbi:MAG: agmatine deiminase family protein [Nocardioides sp.]
MAWRMPAEWTPHERTWMAFPREGITLGETDADRGEGYAAWTAVAHAIADFEPVSMLVDPSELVRAKRMLSGEIEIVEAPLDEYWMRDCGPTFVLDPDRPGVLGAVDWVFNGWGAPKWAAWELSAKVAVHIATSVGAEVISSDLVNEGGGIHVDGAGTVLLTETVQLHDRRNPHATRHSVETELARTIGATNPVWLSTGLTRDYEEFGTNGHVDIVATICSPGTILVHAQLDPAHPDYQVTHQVKTELAATTDPAGRNWEILEIPAPATLRDDEGFVDWSYINHTLVNGGVILCGFDDPHDDAARTLIGEAYPGREVRLVDARPLFARGGGIHCITQQQPAVTP